MPSTFRTKEGQFARGVNLTLADLRSWLLRRPGDHLYLPPDGLPLGSAQGKINWRIRASRFPEISNLFPSGAKASIPVLLWTGLHGRRPVASLKLTCGYPGCLNPHHYEETYMTPDQVYFTYFSQAYTRALDGNPLILEFTSKGEAMAYRHRLNAYRKRGIDERKLPEEWSDLSLRIMEAEVDGETTAFLSAELPSSSLEDALARALGVQDLDSIQAPSALDLLNSEDL